MVATRRGFGARTPEDRRLVAASGGRKAHALGVAHRWTAAEAAEAGRRGWQKRRAAAKASQP